MYRALIPVGTDEDRALTQAEYVSSLPNASDVVEAYLLFVFGEESADLPEEFEQYKSVSRIGSVRRAEEYLEDAGIDVTVLEDSGDAADDIIVEAEEYDVDTIVIASRKRSPVGKAVFGSVTQSVILNSDRPVVVTGNQPE
ncbi:universal stress protein [Natrialbaceae archaeon A-arb3/5]